MIAGMQASQGAYWHKRTDSPSRASCKFAWCVYLRGFCDGIGCFEIRISHPGGDPYASHCLVVLLSIVQLQTLADAFAGTVMAAVLAGCCRCVGSAQPTQYAVLVLARTCHGRLLQICLSFLHEWQYMCRLSTRHHEQCQK